MIPPLDNLKNLAERTPPLPVVRYTVVLITYVRHVLNLSKPFLITIFIVESKLWMYCGVGIAVLVFLFMIAGVEELM